MKTQSIAVMFAIRFWKNQRKGTFDEQAIGFQGQHQDKQWIHAKKRRRWFSSRLDLWKRVYLQLLFSQCSCPQNENLKWNAHHFIQESCLCLISFHARISPLEIQGLLTISSQMPSNWIGTLHTEISYCLWHVGHFGAPESNNTFLSPVLNVS